MDDIPSGITSPTVASIWYIGEPTTISWYGTTSNAVKIEISTDDAATWSTIASNVSGKSFDLGSVKYLETQRALVRVTDGSEVLLSQRFQITRRLAGSTLLTFSEQPLYMYDLAYDADDNTLFVTNFSTGTSGDPKIYKIDPTSGALTGSITISNSAGFFTGIKYDPLTKHLFIHQSRQDNNTSHIIEATPTGTIIHQWNSPCAYGTGILVIGDTLFLADRNNNVIHRVHKTNPSLSYDDFDLTQSGRIAAFGPRCLALNTGTGDLYHTWTDFQGTQTNATLYDSYILKLSRSDGTELGSWFVQEGGNNGTNVRGIEYDPRSNGREVWVTVLNSGNSAKIIKITLVDGLTDAVRATPDINSSAISVYPNPLHDQTTIGYTLPSFATSRIIIRDILGRIVSETTYPNEDSGNHSHSLSLHGLANGSYMVEIYSGDMLLGVKKLAVY
jgi:DNA-binding beta-propeller fold protein YncE